MKVTYIHHSGFLVETDRGYYLFDYEKGKLPELNIEKPIVVLASHSHYDHYNPDIFSILEKRGMKEVSAVLSDDIKASTCEDALMVSPGKEYVLSLGQRLTTLKSTDEGVAFLIEDDGELIYHAGDLNDWVWEEETKLYNDQMTHAYQKEIDGLAGLLQGRELDVAFVVLDPRQDMDYDRGMTYFLAHIRAKEVYPMHYWGQPGIIERFLREHPHYQLQIRQTESYACTEGEKEGQL